MEENIISVENLTQSWRELGIAVKNNKKFKLEMFEETFSETYALLLKSLAENSLDKKIAELVAEAYLFAHINEASLDCTCLAAFVLTERMLDYCAFRSRPSADEVSAIYIIEARKEIKLDFNNVGDSVGKLKGIFENKCLANY